MMAITYTWPQDFSSVVDKKAIYVEDTFCYKDYVCQVSKLQYIYAKGLIPLSVLETTKQTRLYQI